MEGKHQSAEHKASLLPATRPCSLESGCTWQFTRRAQGFGIEASDGMPARHASWISGLLLLAWRHSVPCHPSGRSVLGTPRVGWQWAAGFSRLGIRPVGRSPPEANRPKPKPCKADWPHRHVKPPRLELVILNILPLGPNEIG